MKNIVLQINLKRGISLTVLLCWLTVPSLFAQNVSEAYSTLYNDAVKQIDQKNYSEARILLDKAIQLKSDYPEAIFARGTCSLMLKEWDLACSDFEKSAKLNWQPSFEYLSKYCGDNSYGRKVNRSKK